MRLGTTLSPMNLAGKILMQIWRKYTDVLCDITELWPTSTWDIPSRGTELGYEINHFAYASVPCLIISFIASFLIDFTLQMCQNATLQIHQLEAGRCHNNT
jgi:hypothetical protein